ncbi:tetratricopeptide repeat protein [Haloferula sp. A504]|uniref:tetratricopeptide repeat protein n=1 Tax=Haloferula sp. A504 TaxID=3373601 RepID=UPI0031CA6876|nr:hypothetical protein [Verrucomicrobiaceae bacterium E54]
MNSAKTTHARKSLKRQRKLLEKLALPAFRDEATEGMLDDLEFFDSNDGSAVVLRGMLGSGQLVQVAATGPIDSERSELRFTLLAGLFVDGVGAQTLVVGNLVEPGPFHIQIDPYLPYCGQMSIGCDLVVRSDDEPLVRRRLGELVRLGEDLEWFFPLRMPSRIRWMEASQLETDWTDLPHDELYEFLDAALKVPPAERTPRTLLCLAAGMNRWKDVLRLLREHPEELPAQQVAPLKALALRELGRWLPALEAAEEAGIKDGRYPDTTRLSPSYMHAFIEAGKDIEALEILGQPLDGEPAFYDWLRGLAYHRAGDSKNAADCFGRYFKRWPGDLIGRTVTEELAEEFAEELGL